MSASRPVVKQLNQLIVRADDAHPLFSLATDAELSRRGLLPHAPAAPYVERGADGGETGPRSNIALGKSLGSYLSGADKIQALVLTVAALKRAETFLRESDMLGAATDDHLTIAPSKIEGLDVRLIQ